MNLEAPLVSLFQPIELTDDMYQDIDTSSPQTETAEHNSTIEEDEVIILDDELDSSNDIEILEEVQQVLKRHEEIKLLHNTKKEASPASAALALNSPDELTQRTQGVKRGADTALSYLTSDEEALCADVQLDSPTVYQLRLSPDIVYKLGPDTGTGSQ